MNPHLIDSMTNMCLAIGIWWAIMQCKDLFSRLGCLPSIQFVKTSNLYNNNIRIIYISKEKEISKLTNSGLKL